MVRLLIHLVMVVVGFFVLTQIVVPILFGKKLFGIFRSTEDEELVKAEADRDEAAKELRIAKLKVETETIKTEARKLELDALDSSIDALEQHDESDDDSFQKDLKK